MEINIVRNKELDISKLNKLLSSNNWGVGSLEKLESIINLTWGWVSAENKDKDVVGFVRVMSDGMRHAYICGMIVHPDYRRKGIGTKIMKELMCMLRENNLYPTLVATKGNEKFYEQFGFATQSNGFTAMCIR